MAITHISTIQPFALRRTPATALLTLGLLLTGLACHSPGEQAALQPSEATEVEATTQTPSDPTTAGLAELLTELGVRWSRDDGEIAIEGWINQVEGPIEVLACTSGGKTHESLLVLDCVPHGLHAGLLALGLEPGAPARILEDGSLEPARGDGVALFVRWSDESGEDHEVRAESFVLNGGSGEAMAEAAWIFTGSIQTSTDHGPVYAADEAASLVTTYLDATSVLENPHAASGNDDSYSAHIPNGPAMGSAITLVARAAEEKR